ncbi:MAG: hypothetical protein EOP83_11150 [Verrucomicrobiaceae bacterium]|nr:MAG: hypothetical protein EOP83_11150 [Verrucomicrobiaceae bacterium]
MSNFIDRLIGDDFVWSTITNTVNGPRKRMGAGGFHINCPMCVTRGESADKRMRCGVKPDLGGAVVHCFNCGFKARWKPGETISRNMQGFLSGIGVDHAEISRLVHKAFSYREMFQRSPDAISLIPDVYQPSFDTRQLPPDARPFEAWINEPSPPDDFIEVAGYLLERGDAVSTATTYYWSPNKKHGMNRRVIIPLTYGDRIVGYTARSIDPGSEQRYHMESQPNYLFNAAALSAPKRKYVILCEGIFDALAIDAVGLLGARLNPQQIAWIKSFGKSVILVPDRDRRGAALIDVALQNNWRVAFPALKGIGSSWWDEDVKDCADASKRYGKIWTLLSVIESSTENKLEINLKRKMYV